MAKVDPDKIRKQAKEIMDEFISALDKCPEAKELSFGARRETNQRKAGKSKYEDTDFRDKVLENAPKVEDDQIVAEKKKW
ncbi:hypothetical protein KY335_04115 [Candidatus Woesearchaeota archaeon]|nr:hypothetical protein [Candidatus Woesearchaeota archaeon]